jgi:hypothetical protein
MAIFLPTEMEGMLWKIACVSIMAVMPLFFLPFFTVSIADYLCGVESILDNKRFLLAFGLAIYLLALLFDAFSPVYIVLEAFLSLRAVPIEFTPRFLGYRPFLISRR